jgi:hypothetical protein
LHPRAKPHPYGRNISVPTTQPAYPALALLCIVAEQLAKIAKAGNKEIHPENKRHQQQVFSERVIETVLRVRMRDRPSAGVECGAMLPQAADLARQLQATYCAMGQRAREWLEHIKSTEMLFLAGGDNIDAMIRNLVMVFHAALGEASPVPAPPEKDGKGGKNPKYVLYEQWGMLDQERSQNQPLRDLVFGLLAAAAEAGGRLTFRKEDASGTLAHALDRLRNYLPPGLVPADLLPLASTIQRLKAEFNRLRR